MPSKVSDTDRGYRKFIANAMGLRDFTVTIGLHSEDADGDTVRIAEINEFGGDPGPPARPTITAWADERAEEAQREIADDVKAALKANTDPNPRIDARALKFGAEIQQKVAAGVDPPNAPSTIERKGSSKPLIDTGQFRSSISGKVKRT